MQTQDSETEYLVSLCLLKLRQSNHDPAQKDKKEEWYSKCVWCVHICVCVRAFKCLHTNVQTCMQKSMHCVNVCIYVCMYACIRSETHMHACVRACVVCACVYVLLAHVRVRPFMSTMSVVSSCELKSAYVCAYLIQWCVCAHTKPDVCASIDSVVCLCTCKTVNACDFHSF